MRKASRILLTLCLGLAVAGCLDSGAADSAFGTARAIDTGGRFVTTPRWAPGGGRLLLSGKGGLGLYVVRPVTGRIDELDPAFYGLARWDRFGMVTNLPAEIDDGLRTLYKDDEVRVGFDDYRGRLIVDRHGARRVLAENAWGARVAPDGKLVAFCSGHLPVAELRVVRLDGKLNYSGKGVQPAWLPDGRRLVYAVVQAAAEGGGIVGADLYTLDTASGASVRLTNTPRLIEMQPAVSSSGELAFVEWHSGRLFTAAPRPAGGGS